MFPMDHQLGPVAVEYDAPASQAQTAGRIVKHFTNAYAARCFYGVQDKQERNPRVIRSESTMCPQVISEASVETEAPAAAPKAPKAKKAAKPAAKVTAKPAAKAKAKAKKAPKATAKKEPKAKSDKVRVSKMDVLKLLISTGKKSIATPELLKLAEKKGLPVSSILHHVCSMKTAEVPLVTCIKHADENGSTRGNAHEEITVTKAGMAAAKE